MSNNKLELILGKPSDNISDIVFDGLLAAADKGGRAMLIVPDQAEFETERRLYQRCKESGKTLLFSEIKMTTISKLCDTILEKYEKGKLPADDITKNILMFCAVKDCKEELTAFKNIADRPGFPGRMISTVTMLKAAGYSSEEFSRQPEVLEDSLNGLNQVLCSKVDDISRIYTCYDALLGARYSDRLDSITKAAKLAGDRHFFSDTEVFLQDFDTFTVNQRRFIDVIISDAKKVTMAFITEYGEDKREFFIPVNSEIDHFSEVAEGSVSISGEHNVGSSRDETITGIGSSIFGELSEPADAPSDNVTLVHADHACTELDYAAAEIKRLCTECGYRYNQIALLTPSPAEYKTSIESAFEKYDIPLFCDIPDSMRHMPLSNLVLSLLDLLQNFTIENLLSYIKTGFVRINGNLLSEKDINHFEQFLFVWRLKPSDLEKSFPESTDRHLSTEDAERIRKGVVESLFKLRSELKGKDGAEMTKLVCSYLLDDLDLSKSITGQYIRLDSTDENTIKQIISSYQMQWNVLRSIFESLYTNLKDTRLDISSYFQLFRDICINTPLAKPPQVLDAVIAGDISRTKAYDIKVAFIVGAGFDSFPPQPISGGIFSDYELLQLIEKANMPLGKNDFDSYLYNQYQAYRALTLPSEKLYLCCPALDIAGLAVTASTVFNDIKAIYDVSEVNTDELDDEFFCRSRRVAQQRFASLYHTGSRREADMQLALKIADGSYDESQPDKLDTEFTSLLDAAVKSRCKDFGYKLDKNVADLIFRTSTISATNMEKLSACRFKYFCQNGLKISEPLAKDISFNEIGNAVHHALCEVLKNSFSSEAESKKFSESDDAQLEVSARAALNDYKSNKMLGDFGKSNRFNYIFDNLSVAVTDMLKLFREEFRHSKYKPEFFELPINSENTDQKIDGITIKPLEIKVNDKRTILITGTADRVDILDDKDSGTRYLRIVDYKTGSAYKTGRKGIYGEEIKYGQSTQMLNYLIALCDAQDTNEDGAAKIKAGGVCYIPSGVTNAKAGDGSERLASRIATEHSPKGLYVRYGDCSAPEADLDSYIEGMSTAFDVEDSAKFIDKNNAIISEERFEQLKADCITSNENSLKALFDGRIDAIPLAFNGDMPCEYCDFKDICGNDCQQYNELTVKKPSAKKQKKGDATVAADKGDSNGN